MYKALVHSVPGSGTRFVNEFLERCLGYSRFDLKSKFEDHLSNQIYIQTHVWDDRIAAAEHESVRVVIPLRPPYLTYLTRRYRRLDFTGDPQVNMVGYWKALIQRIPSIDPIYVPVEATLDREKLLQSVAQHLDMDVLDYTAFQKMILEWPKIGTAGEMPERDKFEATGLIDGEHPTFLDFAEDWYKGVVFSLEAVQ